MFFTFIELKTKVIPAQRKFWARKFARSQGTVTKKSSYTKKISISMSFK